MLVEMNTILMQDAMIDRLLADDVTTQSSFIVSIAQLAISQDGSADAIPGSPHGAQNSAAK